MSAAPLRVVAGSSAPSLPPAVFPPSPGVAQKDGELRQRMRRMDELLQEIERFKDPLARSRTREIVQAIMEFHGAAIERMMEKLAEGGAAGMAAIESLAQDELVASVLLLYGQHPVELETRVGQALEKSRPFLRSHGGNVELIGIEDGIVRLRLHGSCKGCPSSAQTLKQTIEEAIFEAAPDVAAVEVADELVAAEPAVAEAGHFALPILQGRGGQGGHG